MTPSYLVDTTGVVSTPLTFAATPLQPDYTGFFCLVLDNVLTSLQCSSLRDRANNCGLDWQSTDARHHISGFRRLQRIVYDDPEIASVIFNAVKNHCPEEIGPDSEWVQITGKTHQNWSKARAETGYWRLNGRRERIRFMKYGAGDYDGPHCDILYEVAPGAAGTNDGQIKSFLSALVFLNDDFEGGKFKFCSLDHGKSVEIEPRVGRVVLYQQRLLLHAGAQVTKGEKLTLRVDINYQRVVISREQRKKKAEERGEVWVDDMDVDSVDEAVL